MASAKKPQLGARSDSGRPVDWWFMYKLPKGIGPKGKKTKGREYLYYDPEQKRPLHLSRTTLGSARSGAFYQTVQQLFRKTGPLPGWIFYNDEYPKDTGVADLPPVVRTHYEKGKRKGRKPNDNSHNGHCKGVLAFDLKTDTAFWLSHSTPRIPPLHRPKQYFYPDYTWDYAQTFICITLDSVATACTIADVMSAQHEPQVFGCRLPEAVTEQSRDGAALWKLAQGSLPPTYGAEYAKSHGHKPPDDITFQSKAGKEFRLIAKSGAWYDDFWIDLVGPRLGVDLRVETWRRLTTTAKLPGEAYGGHDFTNTYKGREYHHEFMEKDGKDVVEEVTNVDLLMLKDDDRNPLGGFHWPYTKDHAKWAISEERTERGVHTLEPHDSSELADKAGTPKDWVVVADINRMTSQEKRGGGAICFHEPLLWHGLNEIERISGKIT